MHGKRASTMAVETAPKIEAGEAGAEADECVICFSEIGKKGSLKCSHSFCLECIRDWAKRENTCPLCKARFTEIEVVDPAAAPAGGARGKRKRATTVKVKNRDQGDGYGGPARNARAATMAADVGFGRLLAAMLEESAPHIRRYFEVTRQPQPRAPTNAAILPRARAPARLPGNAMRPYRRPRPWTPIWDVDDFFEGHDEGSEDDEVELGPTVPAGPTPTQAAARMLQQRPPATPAAPPVVDLVDEPVVRGEPAIVDMTESPPERQRPRLARPEHPAYMQPPRSTRTTVADVGAAMQPMSPFAVASMTVHEASMSSLEAEARRAARVLSPMRSAWRGQMQGSPVVIDLTEPNMDHAERELFDLDDLESVFDW